MAGPRQSPAPPFQADAKSRAASKLMRSHPPRAIIGPMSATGWISAVLPSLLLAPLVAHAGDVDTQFIYGFTQGTDVGEPGEEEIESETIGRFGKNNGSYAALTSDLRFEFVPVANLRLEMGVQFDYHALSGLSDYDDRDAFQFGGLAVEGRYRLLDWRTAPIGLTVGIEPHWTRVDEISGESVASYGSGFLLAIEKELVEDRVFGAVNFLYSPEWTYRYAADQWQFQSALAVSAAIAIQVEEGVFIGGETHYVRGYDGVGLDAFNGDALFVGPTAYARLSRSFSISAAWSVQVAGNANDVPGPLNLRDFERHQARLRFEYTF